MRKSWIILASAAGVAIAGTSIAKTATPEGESVVPNFAHAIPNIPGKSLITVEVVYAPGGQSLPHHHANSAFIYG